MHTTALHAMQARKYTRPYPNPWYMALRTITQGRCIQCGLTFCLLSSKLEVAQPTSTRAKQITPRLGHSSAHGCRHSRVASTLDTRRCHKQQHNWPLGLRQHTLLSIPSSLSSRFGQYHATRAIPWCTNAPQTSTDRQTTQCCNISKYEQPKGSCHTPTQEMLCERYTQRTTGMTKTYSLSSNKQHPHAHRVHALHQQGCIA